MVSFARLQTRSWLARLVPSKVQDVKNDKDQLGTINELHENIAAQNKCFLEVSKNGGMWFS
tara:strand:+ start:498 stop:680 length:183 start_codon:yes stop_codon:yes gene_type:complete